jgi:hypothetical protein
MPRKAKMTENEKQANKVYREADKVEKQANKFLTNADRTQKEKMAKYYKMLDHIKHLRLAGDAFKRSDKNPQNIEEANEHVRLAQETKESYKRKPKAKKEDEEEEKQYMAIKEAIAKKKAEAKPKEEMKEEAKEVEIRVPEFPAKAKKQMTKEEAKEIIGKAGRKYSKRLTEGKELAKKIIGEFVGKTIKQKRKAKEEKKESEERKMMGAEDLISKRVERGSDEANKKMEMVRSFIKKGVEKKRKAKEEKRQADERVMMGGEDVRAMAIEKVVRPKEKGMKFMKEAGSVMKRVEEIEKAKPVKPEPKKRVPKLKADQTQMTAFAKKKDEESESDEEKYPYDFEKKGKFKFYMDEKKAHDEDMKVEVRRAITKAKNIFDKDFFEYKQKKKQEIIEEVKSIILAIEDPKRSERAKYINDELTKEERDKFYTKMKGSDSAIYDMANIRGSKDYGNRKNINRRMLQTYPWLILDKDFKFI